MTADDTFPVIALVGSTGSVRAIQSTLAALPGTLAAAVIVVIHQSPDQALEVLPDLLRRTTELKVSTAGDDQSMRPSEVFVVPPGQHLLIGADRRMRLIDAGPPPPNRPSADLLLATLAMAAGPDAMAVVLSGNGQDGATGATAIRHAGGSVLATGETSSDAFSMPNATIEREHVDPSVVDLEVLPAHLVALVATRTRRPDAGGQSGADR